MLRNLIIEKKLIINIERCALSEYQLCFLKKELQLRIPKHHGLTCN